jgi:hypothetical protein
LPILRRGRRRLRREAEAGEIRLRQGRRGRCRGGVPRPRSWKRTASPSAPIPSSCARRCSSGVCPTGPEGVAIPGVGTGWPAFCALRIGRPRSPGSGGPSLGTPL